MQLYLDSLKEINHSCEIKLIRCSVCTADLNKTQRLGNKRRICKPREQCEHDTMTTMTLTTEDKKLDTETTSEILYCDSKH